jgi:hypothetical protein
VEAVVVSGPVLLLVALMLVLLLLLLLFLLLLLSGVTDDAVLECSNIHPHFILDSFGDLRAVAQQLQQGQTKLAGAEQAAVAAAAGSER